MKQWIMERGGLGQNDRVASPESVTIRLKRGRSKQFRTIVDPPTEPLAELIHENSSTTCNAFLRMLSYLFLQEKVVEEMANPSGHMVQKWCRIDVGATSSRRIDVYKIRCHFYIVRPLGKRLFY